MQDKVKPQPLRFYTALYCQRVVTIYDTEAAAWSRAQSQWMFTWLNNGDSAKEAKTMWFFLCLLYCPPDYSLINQQLIISSCDLLSDHTPNIRSVRSKKQSKRQKFNAWQSWRIVMWKDSDSSMDLVLSETVTSGVSFDKMPKGHANYYKQLYDDSDSLSVFLYFN